MVYLSNSMLVSYLFVTTQAYISNSASLLLPSKGCGVFNGNFNRLAKPLSLADVIMNDLVIKIMLKTMFKAFGLSIL